MRLLALLCGVSLMVLVGCSDSSVSSSDDDRMQSIQTLIDRANEKATVVAEGVTSSNPSSVKTEDLEPIKNDLEEAELEAAELEDSDLKEIMLQVIGFRLESTDIGAEQVDAVLEGDRNALFELQAEREDLNARQLRFLRLTDFAEHEDVLGDKQALIDALSGR